MRRDIAATVSVAHKTLLIIKVYLSVKESKKIESSNSNTSERQINPKIVPTIPRKLINPRFWKNSDFLRLYPAANMMGGSIIEKKISLLNCI